MASLHVSGCRTATTWSRPTQPRTWIVERLGPALGVDHAGLGGRHGHPFGGDDRAQRDPRPGGRPGACAGQVGRQRLRPHLGLALGRPGEQGGPRSHRDGSVVRDGYGAGHLGDLPRQDGPSARADVERLEPVAAGAVAAGRVDPVQHPDPVDEVAAVGRPPDTAHPDADPTGQRVLLPFAGSEVEHPGPGGHTPAAVGDALAPEVGDRAAVRRHGQDGAVLLHPDPAVVEPRKVHPVVHSVPGGDEDGSAAPGHVACRGPGTAETFSRGVDQMSSSRRCSSRSGTA